MTPNTTCAACDTPIYRSPSRLRDRNFCDMACRESNPVRWIGYVFAHHKTMSVKETADHIGMPAPSLRTWVWMYNLWGMNISFPKGPRPVGGITVRELKRREIAARKAERAEEKQIRADMAIAKLCEPRELPRQSYLRVPKVATYPSNRGKPEKKEPQRLPNKVIDMSQYESVRIDSKTVVLRRKTA